MDSMRETLRTGYTLDELVRKASAAQRRMDQTATYAEVRERVERQGDWLVEALLESRDEYNEEREKKKAGEDDQRLEDLKVYIKAHVKAYATGLQWMLGAVLLIQILCVIRLFGGI